MASVTDDPVDLHRWLPWHRGSGMDRYEAFLARDRIRSTLDAHTVGRKWQVPPRAPPEATLKRWGDFDAYHVRIRRNCEAPRHRRDICIHI